MTLEILRDYSNNAKNFDMQYMYTKNLLMKLFRKIDGRQNLLLFLIDMKKN